MQQRDQGITHEPAGLAPYLGGLFDAARNLISQVLNPLNDRSRAQSNALIAFMVRVASAALLYVMQIVLARWMGSFEYGIYGFVWTWVLILGGLAPLGLNIAAIRLVPEYSERKEYSLLRGLVFGSRLIAFATGTAIALAGLLGLMLFGSYISSYYILPAYLALICIPMFAISDMQDGLGRGKAWMSVALIPPYVLRPLLILVFMLGANLFGFPMVATTAAAAAIFATWMATLVQLIILNRKLKTSLTPVQEPDEFSKQNSSVIAADTRQFDLKRWLAISAPLLIISACDLLLQNTDVLIISHYMSPDEVGIYFAAAKTMSLIMFVHYAVGSAVANRFSALKARGDEQGLKDFVRDSLNWTFWPSLTAAMLLLLMGEFLLSLFGDRFASEGYPVMAILAIGFLLRSAVGPADFLLNMLGEQRLCAIVLGGTALLNVVLNLLLVPNFGLIGAAFATASSLSFGAMAQYFAVRQRLGLDLAIWKAFR